MSKTSLSSEKYKNAIKHVLSMQEKIVLVIRTALQLVPYGIGSAIDQAYFGMIDEIRAKRVQGFMDLLVEDLKTLSKTLESLDVATIKTDEFAYCFENVLRRVMNEVQEEKLTALRGALVSIITDPRRFEFEVQSSFLKTIDSLEGVHIRILALLASRYSLREENRYLSVEEIWDHLSAREEFQRNFLYSALDVLANREFIISGPVPFDAAGRIDKPKQRFRLTALGMKFLEFIRAELAHASH